MILDEAINGFLNMISQATKEKITWTSSKFKILILQGHQSKNLEKNRMGENICKSYSLQMTSIYKDKEQLQLNS